MKEERQGRLLAGKQRVRPRWDQFRSVVSSTSESSASESAFAARRCRLRWVEGGCVEVVVGVVFMYDMHFVRKSSTSIPVEESPSVIVLIFLYAISPTLTSSLESMVAVEVCLTSFMISSASLIVFWIPRDPRWMNSPLESFTSEVRSRSRFVV